jgi:hypothetical protein
MTCDRVICPQCGELRAVLYFWDDQARLKCICNVCRAVFPLPLRDEKAAQQRAVQTCAEIAQRNPR